MFAVKVRVNDCHPLVGGASDLSVLNATLTLVGALGPDSYGHQDKRAPHFRFTLGGLSSRPEGRKNEHFIWLERNELKLGDHISLEIVETESPDPIVSGKEAEKREHNEQEYFEHCKRAYMHLRQKYESGA